MRSLILSLFILVCAGCGASGGGKPVSVGTPGGLQLVGTKTHASTQVTRAMAVLASAEVVAADFEMGDLNKTSTYLFELRNIGTTNLTNIALTSDNPAVTIVPSSIGIISSSGSGGIIPIIQVTVAHGLSPNGIGPAPTLAPGRLVFTIWAQVLGGNAGHPTTDPQPCRGKDQIKASDAEATIGATVRVTKFTIKAGGDQVPGGVTLTDRNVGTNFENFDGNDPILVAHSNFWTAITQDGSMMNAPIWFLDEPEFWGGNAPEASKQHGNMVIANTGNTPITVRRYDPSFPSQPVISPFRGTYTIQPGGSVSLSEVDLQVSSITDGNGNIAVFTDTMLTVQGSGAVFADGNIQPNNGSVLWVRTHADPIWRPFSNG